MTAPFTALILAAGMGKRMASDLPKVLHPALGKPLVLHVLGQLQPLHPARIVVVVGHKEDLVRKALGDRNIHFVTQAPQLGTGHAVQMAWPELEQGPPTILVLAGDMPLVRTVTLKKLIDRHLGDHDAVTFLSGELDDPSGYGRVVRDNRGDFQRIVEEKDATSKERKIAEVNSGIYCFERGPLGEALGALQPDNAQKEYYLTDTLTVLLGRGQRVGALLVPDSREMFGVNTPEQLTLVEETLRAWGEA